MSFVIRFTGHQRGEQVIIHAEFGIDLIHIRVLPLHKHGELFLCQHHLHEVGFQTSNVDWEIQILFLRGGVADKPHIKLAHAGVVVVHLRNDDLIDKLEVDAGGKALLRAEQDAVLTVPQYLPQSAPLGKGDGGACHHKEGPVRKVFTDGGGVTVQHRCMPHADGYNFFRPPGKGFHNGHLLERCLAFVFLHAVRSGTDAQKQCDLLNKPHQCVLPAVSGRIVIFTLDAVKLLQHDIVDLPLLREKRNRHLMDTADVLSRDLFKGAGNDRLSQQPIQLVGVVDVLISLSHAKDGDFLRQMGVCEQAVALFISGNRHPIIGVFLVLHIFRPLIVAVKRSTP